MALFNVLFDIAAKTASFESSMTKVERRFDSIASYAKKAGAAVGIALSFDAIKSSITAAIEYGDAIGNAATKSGIAASTFSELAHAANMSDVSLDSLSTAIKKMQTNLAAGSDEFDKLGLTMQRLRGLSPDKQFELIAQRISEIQDPAERTAAAVAIFGRAGADLLPMFEQGAAGIRAAREEAQKLGIAMSDDVVKTLQEGDDAIKRLHASWEAFKRSAAVTTVKGLQAADIFDKDEIGELRDQLAVLNNEQLKIASSSRIWTDEGKRSYAELGAQIKETISQIERARVGAGEGTRGGGGRNGPSSADLAYRKQIAEEMEKEQKAATEYARVMEQLQEIQISSKKIADDNPWPQYYEDAAAAANDAVLDLQELANANAEWADGIAANTTDAIVDNYRKNVDTIAETSEYAKESARIIYSTFSDAFYNLGTGANTFAEDMINAFKRVLANAATDELFSMLSELGSSMSGSGSTGSTIGSFLTTIFGGAKAAGGPVSGGKTYLVGEQGPELFMPGGAGNIVPNDQLAATGGGTVAMTQYNTFNAGADKDLRSSMPSLLKQTQKAAVAEIIDMKRRGKL